jgi:protein gp37
MTRRLAAMGQEKYKGLINDGKKHFNGVVKMHEDAIDIPLKRKKPTVWFVNSMSDLFHKEVYHDFIDKVMAVAALTPWHTYQILTKRADLAEQYFKFLALRTEMIGLEIERIGGVDRFTDDGTAHRYQLPLKNVWIGASVEDGRVRDRIDHLRNVPAAVRFLSCEPLLGPLDNLDLTGIHWVIAGGESGHGARPVHPDWVRSLRDQCSEANVAFFFKQWGEWVPCSSLDEAQKARETLCYDSGTNAWYRSWGDPPIEWSMKKVGKHNSGRLLDGVEHSAFPVQEAALG